METDILTTEGTSCFHCGEECSSDAIQVDEKPFCCEGCKLVYQVLEENDLDNYYQLQDQPGTSQLGSTARKRFDYLDDESLLEKLADFQNDHITRLSLYIPGIHCTSCVWLLENLYKLNEGITQCSVNFLKRELSLTFDHRQTSLRQIAELLNSIGYEPDLRLDRFEKKAKTRPDHRLWLKLGVAGFAFGNIMLFSFPDYLAGTSTDLDGTFSFFFGFLNIALALPVLFYSSSDYLKSAWAAVRQGGVNLDVPISIGIMSLFGRSVYEIVLGIGTGYMDSFTGLVFFLLIGRIVQKKTYERLAFDRDYRSYLPLSVTIVDDEEKEHSISINKITEGVRMLIRNQELIPADATLLSDQCFVDYSFITGESEPVKIEEGDTIYAGGRIVGKSALMVATREVSNSYLTKLWNDAAFDSESKGMDVSSLADRISPHFTLAVLAIAMAAALWWLPAGAEQSINVFTAVLIIACPCALALSTPFTLGSVLNILSRSGLYVKGIEVVEKLAKVTDVVFDKTGTLTRSDQADVTFKGDILKKQDKEMIKSVCKQSVHPLSQKIVTFLGGIPLRPVEQFEEQVNKGLKAMVNGHHILIGSASFLEEQSGGSFSDQEISGRAVSVVHVAIDGKWRGWFELSSMYRRGIPELLSGLKEQFSTYLISGDNDQQKQELEVYFDKESLLFNQKPQEKLDFIKELQHRDRRILMVGDGLNDAGALQQSNFGIALTDNVSSFTPACDAILDGDAISMLDRFISFARKSIHIILWSFGISLVYNIVGLSFAVTGHLSPLVAAVLMPLSSISIMVFTSVTTHLTAKKMGLAAWK
ncbi:heavy metal translocating P-type ATPase metal-binding domain-containing protein [Aliifodinibius sp. S!AR15-10]|uniref:heavy metal translocating P-type ATPase n=1 Tax=Aliifodinibius sp. S!AR15-10 TaxID=2950437 RepID=UPI002856D828|nr:heavy metal translocating P-type ATPase metal-binding domain-containing protein [Aliifodinibius sp. S!AR15-10]MDR8393420.1 heavy metal translocating P-type ATPase metal-binding domain-containing protein [Aliifodinibius sp. S!AR15-10]